MTARTTKLVRLYDYLTWRTDVELNTEVISAHRTKEVVMNVMSLGDIGRVARNMCSMSASSEGLFSKYQQMFRAKCEAEGVSSPFELKAEKMREFFTQLSAEWKAAKLKMVADGEISEEKV